MSLTEIILLNIIVPAEIIYDHACWFLGKNDKPSSTYLRAAFGLAIIAYLHFIDITTFWQAAIALMLIHEALFSAALNLTRFEKIKAVYQRLINYNSSKRGEWELFRFVIFYHPDKGWDKIYHRYIPWQLEAFLKPAMLFTAYIIYNINI